VELLELLTTSHVLLSSRDEKLSECLLSKLS
jgi:hypothetical protein